MTFVRQFRVYTAYFSFSFFRVRKILPIYTPSTGNTDFSIFVRDDSYNTSRFCCQPSPINNTTSHDGETRQYTARTTIIYLLRRILFVQGPRTRCDLSRVLAPVHMLIARGGIDFILVSKKYLVGWAWIMYHMNLHYRRTYTVSTHGRRFSIVHVALVKTLLE